MRNSPTWTVAVVPALAALLYCSDARAQDALSSVLSSVRVGGLSHDIGGIEPGPEVNGEIQFRTPFPDWGNTLPAWIAWVTRPRPVVGVDINTAGATSQGYIGLAWTLYRTGPIFSSSDSIFFDGGFAPAINGGYTDISSTKHKSLGTNLLFRSDAEIGYNFTPMIMISATIAHSSNAGLSKRNPGFTDVGMRIGFDF